MGPLDCALAPAGFGRPCSDLGAGHAPHSGSSPFFHLLLHSRYPSPMAVSGPLPLLLLCFTLKYTFSSLLCKILIVLGI